MSTQSIANLYFKLYQAQQNSAEQDVIQKLIQQIANSQSVFSELILGLNILGVYKHPTKPGSFLFFEDAAGYFFLDNILEESRNPHFGKLTLFGLKSRVSKKEALEYIDEILRFGNYQLDDEDTILLWLASPSQNLNINNFVLTAEKDEFGTDIIMGTTPNGEQKYITHRADIKSIKANELVDIFNYVKILSEEKKA